MGEMDAIDQYGPYAPGGVAAVPFYEDPIFYTVFGATGGISAAWNLVEYGFNYMYVKAQILTWRLMDALNQNANSPFEGTSNLKFKNIASQSADEVNASLRKLGYTEAPYKPGTIVDTIELSEQTQFVRVYDGVNSQQVGGWIMKAEDIAGLTPQQIQNKFALPSTSTHVTDVILESETQLRTGIANGLFGFDGGGTQFDLMGQYIGEFVNGRLLP